MKLTPPLFLSVEKILLPGMLLPTDSLLGDNCPADLPTEHTYEVAPLQPMSGQDLLSLSRLS